MIVYDKEQKEIVIPNGIGNINLFNNGVEAGYNQGKIDGIDEQKSKLESISITENGTYSREDGYNHIEVNVPDLNGSYDEGYEQGHTEGYNEGYTEGEGVGYNQGKTDGINEQKGKLSQITISENGTYAKEDGYNKVIVNVPDLNGDYNEGYEQGKTEGEQEGYEQGQADIVAKARVLDVTENGVYKSKYSDPIIPDTYTVTGVYADGTNFYNYAELNGKVFNTKIAGSLDSRLEFWYKGDSASAGFGNNIIIGAGNNDDYGCFKVNYHIGYNSWVRISVGTSEIDISDWDDTVWHHLIISKAEGLWVDGEKKGDFVAYNTINGEFFINGIGYDTARNANGCFGMIKIDNTTIIPTADGFQNVNTGELLKVVKDGGYNFTENLPTYPEGEGELYKTINVNIDVDSYYNNGYNQGKTDGVNEQKSKLESISITENGTYTKEDGYNNIVVNVPDLNGSYNEGYEQGQADVAANARVLNVTENGVYRSKFSDPIVPTTVTGVYADGTNFYSYAELNGKVFNTKIAGSVDSRLEFWYKGDNQKSGDAWNVIIGSGDNDDNNCFQVRYYVSNNNILIMSIGNSSINIRNWDDTVWHHLIVSKAEGLWVDGEKKGDFTPTNTINGEFFINGIGYNKDGSRSANGTFGMIKIDDVVFIPTADGFQNVNTGELLKVVKDGGYNFTENLPIYPKGELYKTINVNVIPKINPQKAGLRLGYSIFTEIPEWLDFNGITDMSNMFRECSHLRTIQLIDTSNATNMSYMFYDCTNLQTIPLLDTSNVKNMEYMFGYSNLKTIPLLNTSNVTSMTYMFFYCENLQTIPQIDTSNVTNMEQMFMGCTNLQTIPHIDTSNVIKIGGLFYSCQNLQTIPPLDTSKATDMGEMFNGCKQLTSLPAFNAQSLDMPSYSGIFGYSELPKLTDFGGLLNLKCSLVGDYNLIRLPNLTYESCINVLNGLYDFTGNGETPNSNQGKLKVHQNFLDKVGEEISIGVAKGWTITA